MQYTLGEIANIAGFEAKLTNPAQAITELAYDTRNLLVPSRALFFALQSGSRNGHNYIPEAYSKGVRAFVVEHGFDVGAFPDAGFISVESPLRAMQQIAEAHRKRFDIPVLGITGSNGKTIVKEWLYQLLSPERRIVRSPKSFNSQIGVSLSLILIEENDELALIEAGISERGEMARLAEMIRPTIGLFTNLGPAHSEGFSSPEEKAREKALLFRQSSTIICCRDHAEVSAALKEVCPDVPLFTWGRHPKADVRIEAVEGHYLVIRKGLDERVELPFSDPASVENALHCLAVMLHLGYPVSVFNERIRHVESLPLRLELKAAQRDSILVYDCYNSDVRSLQIALDMLQRHAQDKQRLAILSDIMQSGLPEAALYREVAAMLQQRGVRELWAVGDAMWRQADNFREAGIALTAFPDTDALIASGMLQQLEGRAVLLKGARHFRFERIGRMLEARIHGTTLEISLPALAANLKVYRSLLPTGTRIMAMVKAFGYGSGSHEIAGLLQYYGVDMLAVAYTEEGVELRKARINMPVMVMNPDPDSLSRLVANNLEPEVYSVHILRQLVQVMPKGSTLRIHLKLDTGMHRLGLEPQHLREALDIIGRYKLEVGSVFTHLSATELRDKDSFTEKQVARFQEMYAMLAGGLGYHPLRHVLNSAGIVRFPQYTFEMVRPGLGLYGVDPSGLLTDKLQQVATLRTIVSQVKEVQPGEPVGYGAEAASESARQIATVAIGYADGYSRALSNGKGFMQVHGQEAPVVGKVCMDMTMLDVTGIPNVKAGDEVLVFGQGLPVEKVAAQSGTIPYEVLSGISQRVKRIYTED
jgi:Alr-MurF fusion protein